MSEEAQSPQNTVSLKGISIVHPGEEQKPYGTPIETIRTIRGMYHTMKLLGLSFADLQMKTLETAAATEAWNQVAKGLEGVVAEEAMVPEDLMKPTINRPALYSPVNKVVKGEPEPKRRQTSPVCTCSGAGHNPKTCEQTKWVAQDILIAEEEERVERNQNGKGMEASMRIQTGLWRQENGIKIYEGPKPDYIESFIFDIKRRTTKVVATIIDGMTYQETMNRARAFAVEEFGTTVGMTVDVLFRVGQKVRVALDGEFRSGDEGIVVDPKVEKWPGATPPMADLVPVSIHNGGGYWLKRDRLETIPEKFNPAPPPRGEALREAAGVSTTVIDDPVRPWRFCEYKVPVPTDIFGYPPDRPAGFKNRNHPEHVGIVAEWKRDLRSFRETQVGIYRRRLGAKPWPHCTAAGAVADGRRIQPIVGRPRKRLNQQPRVSQVLLICPPCARKQKAMVRKIREVAKEIEPLRQT